MGKSFPSCRSGPSMAFLKKEIYTFLSHDNFSQSIDFPKIHVYSPSYRKHFTPSFRLTHSYLTMSSKFWVGTALTLAALHSTARGQTDSYQANSFQGNFTTNWNPYGEGCVDPTGFLSCYATQSSKASSCTSACASSNTKGSSTYNICVNECKELWLADNIGCWIQSCWNQVCFMPYRNSATNEYI
jgi:hypothetical protein